MKIQESADGIKIENIVGEKLYYQLFDALQTATLYEIRLSQFLHEKKGFKHDPVLLQKIKEITSVELPECMGRLIGLLDLHNSFLSLGRYIRSFADAEFVVVKLQVLITEQLSKDAITSASIINRVVLCCDDLLETTTTLMEVGKI